MAAFNWGTEALMFGNLMILASGFLAKFPNSNKSFETCCSSFKTSENIANMRAANEISLGSKIMLEDAVNDWSIGKSDWVAKAGASSVLV
jgi:hypothetical protein